MKKTFKASTNPVFAVPFKLFTISVKASFNRIQTNKSANFINPISRLILFVITLGIQLASTAQINSKLLETILQSDPALKKVIDAKKKYKPQILYTQINRDANQHPSFKTHSYLVDSNQYFYCASLVKLPVSILALEKLNRLGLPGLTRRSPMLTDSANLCQKKNHVDSSSQNFYPSIEHHIKKMLLVSDNQSFGRVFEFVTPPEIQTRLSALGYPRARIVHRLDPACVGQGNKYFNPIRFLNDSNRVVYSQPADSLHEPIQPVFKNLVLGRNIYNKKKRLISEKKDFTNSNYLSLNMIHRMLMDLVFMNEVPPERRYKISEDDRQFLLTQLGSYPRESQYPAYPAKPYYDSFKKYFMYGSAQQIIESDSIRIFNIVGRAYGYIIDCAYIVDYKANIEFFLSSVIYVNKRNSFGSGKYEYDAVGLPFLKELSLALYSHEKNRQKKHLPNLESVNFFKTP